MDENKLMFCPLCGSTNIIKIHNPPSLTQGFAPFHYERKKCGYKHSFFPVAKDEAELKKIQKELRRKLKEDFKKK